jgi:hypothetical protein
MGVAALERQPVPLRGTGGKKQSARSARGSPLRHAGMGAPADRRRPRAPVPGERSPRTPAPWRAPSPRRTTPPPGSKARMSPLRVRQRALEVTQGRTRERAPDCPRETSRQPAPRSAARARGLEQAPAQSLASGRAKEPPAAELLAVGAPTVGRCSRPRHRRGFRGGRTARRARLHQRYRRRRSPNLR